MAAQMKYRWPKVHLLVSICGKVKQALHCIFPMQPYFVAGQHHPACCYSVLCFRQKSDSDTLKWCALVACEHYTICESGCQRALFGAIKKPKMGCEGCNCTVRVTLAFSSPPAFTVSTKYMGDLKGLNYLLLLKSILQHKVSKAYHIISQ